MWKTVRRAAYVLAATLGITAATTAPAFAGASLMNHCEPATVA
jgi:hypothetical protein